MKTHKDFTIVIEQTKDGTYIASVAELKGCCAEAKTMEELQELIKLAIKQHLGDKDARINLEDKKGDK
ncbi:MAG: type II toxin-antitoxin system HicB family antitoxin [Planctomycetes bacterium]|nr:type II toxin-antitoxin system HicB family antitoxin [Planctomycetota bacterium]